MKANEVGYWLAARLDAKRAAYLAEWWAKNEREARDGLERARLAREAEREKAVRAAEQAGRLARAGLKVMVSENLVCPVGSMEFTGAVAMPTEQVKSARAGVEKAEHAAADAEQSARQATEFAEQAAQLAQVAKQSARHGAEQLAAEARVRSGLRVMVSENSIDVKEFVEFTTTVMDAAAEEAAALAREAAEHAELAAEQLAFAVRARDWAREAAEHAEAVWAADWASRASGVAEDAKLWMWWAAGESTQVYVSERAVNAVRLSALAKIVAAVAASAEATPDEQVKAAQLATLAERAEAERADAEAANTEKWAQMSKQVKVMRAAWA